MSRQIQIRRGTAAENNVFTGAIGEITMDTTNKTLRIHDGETAGGTTLAKQSEIPDLTNADYVIESQTPSADNNYTWYRKYKSGWVEQGGQTTSSSSGPTTITLPVVMSSTYYNTSITTAQSGNWFAFCAPTSTTQITIRVTSGTDQMPTAKNVSWEVKGVKA